MVNITTSNHLVTVTGLKGKNPEFKITVNTKRINGPIETREETEFWVDVPILVPARRYRTGPLVPERNVVLHFDLENAVQCQSLKRTIENAKSSNIL